VSPVEPCSSCLPEPSQRPGWASVWFGGSLVARPLKKVTLNRAAPARTCIFGQGIRLKEPHLSVESTRRWSWYPHVVIAQSHRAGFERSQR
jgi:hypothetical protein